MDLEHLCKEAIDIVRIAGEYIRSEHLAFSYKAVEHKGHNDLVSYVDKMAEKQLTEGLLKLLPEAGFITEEKTINLKGKTYNWIIDPLDGTTNFIHGVPCFCISVALASSYQPAEGLLEDTSILIGIVYEINFDECYYAWKSGGAFLNGKRINVSAANHLKDSLLATGFPYSNYTYMKQYMEVFDYCMYNTHGLRRLGSAAADLAYVACGRFEGFYEYGLHEWDVAAGVLLVIEAGGKVNDFKGGSNYLFGKELIASNGTIQEEFLEIVKKAFASVSN